MSSIYGFAQHSGGFMTIVSQVGIGSTIGVFLPRVASNPDFDTHTTVSEITNEAQEAGNELILVVEDDDMLRELNVQRLRNIGYRVIEASSGQEAIELLKNNLEIRLVFSDVIMPEDMTVFDLVRWVSGNRPTVKMLLTTGYFDHKSVGTNQLAENSVPILEKPYEMHRLASTVQKLLDE